MFLDEVTNRIRLAMGSMSHPGSTIQSSVRYLSLMRPCPFSITSLDQANNPCSTVQALKGVSVFDETRPFYLVVQALRGICLWWDHALRLLPRWTYNNYLRPGLNMVINPNKLALLPTASIDKSFLVIVMQFSIGKMIKRRQNSITVYQIDRTSHNFHNQWVGLSTFIRLHG